MTKRRGSEQLNLLDGDRGETIVPTSLHLEMQRSYLEYAMSVIVGRALPDVRDGLKPVHRRVIFAMHELGLLPDRPFRKCARVVGDVLGKYHPHGDQSVYDALVRLVQDFSCRYPLLAGHGNFGSIDNDPPAAMRYTECRLAAISHEALLPDIDEAIVDFTDNFDGSQREPTVLPAQLPMLLLNGASGIAVGMATNIPPHNLGELVDGTIALIDDPDLSDDRLIELIPAPDFPTGGVLVNAAGVRDAYTKGRGSLTLRGVATVEELANLGRGRRSRQAIVVTELPFQVNKAAWIEKVAELANQGRLEGIADLRDESDRTGMRVVIELKKDTQPDAVLEGLYRHTALQANFGVIMLALVGAEPRQMTLKEMLGQFIEFRETTLVRRYRFEREKAEQRLHLVAGLVTVLADIDTLIAIVRHAADSAAAKEALQERFELTATQADGILAMPLRRLTGLEREALHAERDELQARLQQLDTLLGDRRELLKAMKKELRGLKRKFGDARRTRLGWQEMAAQNGSDPNNTIPSDIEVALAPASPAEPEDTIVQVTYRGYVRRAETATKAAIADDMVVATYPTRTDRSLIVFTESARAFPLAVGDIPDDRGAWSAKQRGTPLSVLLPDSADRVVAQLAWEDDPDPADSLVLLTAQSRIKRTPLAEFANLTARGPIAMKLKDDDRLFWVGRVPPQDRLAIATSNGRILCLHADESQIPPLGRTACGNQTLRLRREEVLVGAVPLPGDREGAAICDVLLVTARGYAKRIPSHALKPAQRTSIGVQAISFTAEDDALVAIAALSAEIAHIHLAIERKGNSQPRILAIAVADLPLEGCNGRGKSVADLEPGERVACLAVR